MDMQITHMNSIENYLLHNIACAQNVSESPNMDLLLSIYQQNRVHLLKFNWKFIPIAMGKRIRKTLKLSGDKFTAIAIHVNDGKWPKQQDQKSNYLPLAWASFWCTLCHVIWMPYKKMEEKLKKIRNYLIGLENNNNGIGNMKCIVFN